MPISVGHKIFSPRAWLAIGAFCIGAAFVVGYHEEHRSAQQLLHQKVGNPEEVALQDFVPDLHMNLIQQISVLGEIDLSHSVRVDVGTPELPHWITALPVYPVSASMMPIANKRLYEKRGEQRRPMPRDQAEQIAARRAALIEMEDQAFAFAIMKDSIYSGCVGSPGESCVEVLGEAEGRLFVQLLGAVVTGSDLHSRISDGMAKEGVNSTPGTILVEPARLERGLISTYQADVIRIWLSVLGISCAIAALIIPLYQARGARVQATKTDLREVAATESFPSVSFFEPIATQDEIQDEERAKAEAEREKRATRRVSNLVSFAVGRAKNPQ